MNKHITASPLTWPESWKRSSTQQSSRFGKFNKRVSVNKAVDAVIYQLKTMKILDWNIIISTNLPTKNDGLPYSNKRDPDDKGASVWWTDNGQQRVIALDKYDRTADNLYAIAKTIEAMRGIERWGSGEILERTFTGFNALPSPDNVSVLPWRDILNYYGNDLDEANIAYKKARSKAHTDHGGSTEEYYLVNQAWSQAEQELSK